jgi:hypothetical protein
MMNLRDTNLRARKVLADVDRFMRDVRPEVAPDHPVHQVEEDHGALLRMFFAGLLVDRGIDDETSVWSLLEACVPGELVSDPRVQQEKEYLSRPLAGTPTTVLTRLHLMNHKGPWFELQQAIRARLSDQERNVLLLVDLALER